MSSSQKKSKKDHPKPPRGRPEATSAISHAVVEDSSTLTALSSFSPDGHLFAFLSLAIDKHRLRIYDTLTDQSVAEHIVDNARVTSLCWARLHLSQNPSGDSESAQPSKKRRKKRSSQAASTEMAESSAVQVVILGLSDGTTQLFSPTHSRILKSLSHTSSSAPILSIAVSEKSGGGPSIWTCGGDGYLRLWDEQKSEVVGSWKYDDQIPYSCLTIRPPSEDEDQVDVLVANHSIRMLSFSRSPTSLEFPKPKDSASFTGHASPITSLQWMPNQHPSKQFVSMAQADRHIYLWNIPESSGKAVVEGKLLASIPLDSDARHLCISNSPSLNILTVSASGKISLFPVPSPSPPAGEGTKTKHKVRSLEALSNIAITAKKNASSMTVINACFIPDEEGRLRVARSVGGVRPAFDVVSFLDDSGEFIPEVKLVLDDGGLGAAQPETAIGASTKRYAEHASLAVGSGLELGQASDLDDMDMRNVDGDLDVNLAELSLGQRLTALSGANPTDATSDSEEDEPSDRVGTKGSNQKNGDETGPLVPANSLTRTLIQALHSSDSRLLETCLTHSDPSLIRNTVRRLPPQLAVPLLNACVERLGRGARANNMKGGGGGASTQRGMGLITWVKTVLTVHSGHLMTMPDLVARLSGLHATLSARLTLQESLLSLNGRLDMVLSQIEMRSTIAPAPLATQKGRDQRGNTNGKAVTRYVEGESEDEAGNDQMDVEVESDDDSGSIEDVELGGESDEDDESDEGEDDEDDEDGEGPRVNGFIDDEAEEFEEDEDEDYSE
ncbi:hypothetical protein JAAARDRAFT_134890 [Jaapia argillacea MUCL 33604]|uniref:Small-subunit processome Utp12 domain-containing protein n=1 Tax=Jaapia argillacea MUCL 33604 TaxID=933084 RepID=A0A067PJ09_9AGAM|nr:hypothetical protein JAAARDRAFT_134890 [Jaapia argillacea MUCL 33604]